MAQELKKRQNFATSPDTLLEILTDPDFNVDREKAQGALEATYQEKSRDAQRVVGVVSTVEYARGMTGVDKSKTEKNVTTYNWNLTLKSCTWTYESDSPFNDKFRVSGAMKISGSGAPAVLESTVAVSISVPLVGKKIEKMVLKEIDQAWSNFDKVVENYIAKQG